MTQESPFVRSTPADLTAGSPGISSTSVDLATCWMKIISSNVVQASNRPLDISTLAAQTSNFSDVSLCAFESISGRKKAILYGVYFTFWSNFSVLDSCILHIHFLFWGIDTRRWLFMPFSCHKSCFYWKLSHAYIHL